LPLWGVGVTLGNCSLGWPGNVGMCRNVRAGLSLSCRDLP
jgi:hypothetical protein